MMSKPTALMTSMRLLFALPLATAALLAPTAGAAERKSADCSCGSGIPTSASPDWSNSGQIAYAQTLRGNTDLYVMNRDGSHKKRLTHDGADNGEPAFTGCVAWGLERWVLACFTQHGFEPSRWPAEVRAKVFG